jgi:protein TonB
MTYEGSKVYIAPEVDRPVTRDPSSDGPVYPDSLRQRLIEGSALAQFIVDTSGHADTASLLVESDHPGFAGAVHDALPRMRFVPAMEKGEHVPQLVMQRFIFRLNRVDSTRVVAHAGSGARAAALDGPKRPH